MSPDERVFLRQQLLKNLYEHHFSFSGTVKVVTAEELKDDEYFLAYKYLSEKGCIQIDPPGLAEEQGKDIGYRITAQGIDLMEIRQRI
ncbi:MAG: hypothetical protein JL50_09760 [Peptococcaceae bacterium BICA1-7]|nr:MAG: hypothetical protein JL50_09760 [Peptococcaceae bacterium BICA1-7]HBV95567.1 hypothetical protein [Desulfotomaculum sp.]